ncbi:MAG TPA: histidine kinase, partial [Terriglobales bacterium]
GNVRRQILYFTLWALVGALLAYQLTSAGLPRSQAWALAMPMELLYAFACLPVWYTCRALPLSRVAAGPELPRQHGARSQGQACEIRNGAPLPGSDSGEGARSKWREAAAGDGEGAYTDVRDRAGYGENEAPRRLSPRPTPYVGGTLVAQAVAAVVAGGLWSLVAYGLAFVYGFPPLGQARLVLLWAAGILLYGLVVAGFYLVLEVERSRDAERLAHAAELRALKAQLNPHFLYNSLNSISALTAADPGRAREMCVRLADFLRRTLALSQAGPEALVSLEEEMALARTYLAIEQVRFGARLRVEEEISAALLATPVPPLVLQPLLENAVVHGINQLTEGGRIGITAAQEEGRVRIMVANPYDPDAPRRRRGGEEGVGLRNVHQRLRSLFGPAAGLTAAASDGEFAVTLTLPRGGN